MQPIDFCNWLNELIKIRAAFSAEDIWEIQRKLKEVLTSEKKQTD